MPTLHDSQLARQFGYFSEAHAKQLKNIRPEFEPYVDWFTFNRWALQGFSIKRGSKGTKLIITKEREINKPDGTTEVEQSHFPVYVFHRGQVERN